jgi:hypothetical protein
VLSLLPAKLGLKIFRPNTAPSCLSIIINTTSAPKKSRASRCTRESVGIWCTRCDSVAVMGSEGYTYAQPIGLVGLD